MPTTLENTPAIARPSLAEVRKAQELQMCNMAYEESATWNEENLRDFTVHVVKLPAQFSEFVGKALVEKDKTGNPCWQTADSPLKYLGKVASNLMKKEKGAESSRVLLALDAATRFVRNSPRDNDCGTSDQDKLDRLIYHNDNEEAPLMMDSALETKFSHRIVHVRGEMHAVRETDYDWKLIGKRLGLTSEQSQLLDARALRVPAELIAEFLNWTEKDVARVWRSISRRMEDPNFARHAKEALQWDIGKADSEEDSDVDDF